MKIDLHCHSNCSDGEYPFTELLQKALSLEIHSLAVTDHDTVMGYLSMEQSKATHSSSQTSSQINSQTNSSPAPIENHDPAQAILRLYTGVEISTRWSGIDIHIVGLDFDPHHPALQKALARQNESRDARASSIAKKLEAQGIHDALAAAQAIAKHANIARPHFAQVLVDQGKVKDIKQAFDRYLGQGKSCYHSTEWPDIAEAISLIRAAGGIAVMAHPTRYKMTATKLRRLVSYFAENGGQAIEFVGGTGHQDSQKFLSELCLKHSLLGSPASDFHNDKQVWQRLGQTGKIPNQVQGVWEHFGEPFACINKQQH